ncbi:MAG: ribose transport system permease protein [Frankiaceae bacterium]|jgi:ribose transport system permease protein|nr:ribose transport system permease protein [Frankiaceae bacterium]
MAMTDTAAERRDSEPEPDPTRRGWSERLLDLRTREGASFTERYAGVAFLLVLVATFSILRPRLFPTTDNFIGIIGNEAVSGIVALGILVPLAAGSFDVSIGGMMTLAVVEVTWLFQATHGHIPIPVAILLVLLTAVVVGLCNALLVVKAKVEPLIATIGTGTILSGLSQMIGNGETITRDIPPTFTKIGRAFVYRIPVTTIIFGVLAIALWYVLAQTPAGRVLYATGAGREAARLSGVRTDRVVMLSYVTAAVGAGIAGIVFAARLGSGPPGAGGSYLLPAFATAFLGATMIKPGRFNVGGVVVAILIIAVGINGLQILGIPFWVVDLFQGTALVVAVLLTKLQARRL